MPGEAPATPPEVPRARPAANQSAKPPAPCIEGGKRSLARGGMAEFSHIRAESSSAPGNAKPRGWLIHGKTNRRSIRLGLWQPGSAKPHERMAKSRERLHILALLPSVPASDMYWATERQRSVFARGCSTRKNLTRRLGDSVATLIRHQPPGNLRRGRHKSVYGVHSPCETRRISSGSFDAPV